MQTRLMEPAPIIFPKIHIERFLTLYLHVYILPPYRGLRPRISSLSSNAIIQSKPRTDHVRHINGVGGGV